MPWPLYLQAHSSQCPLNGRLGGLQNQFGYYGEEGSLLPLSVIEPWFFGCPACCLVAIPMHFNIHLTFAVSPKLIYTFIWKYCCCCTKWICHIKSPVIPSSKFHVHLLWLFWFQKMRSTLRFCISFCTLLVL